MKNIIRQIIAAIFTLTFAALIFAAAPAKNTGATASYRGFEIPQTVLDRNFRERHPAQPVPLVAAPINDIMMTDGRAIYYNPVIVNQVPPKIAAFFLAHEYGHIYGRAGSEFLADQFAARVYAETDMSVVKTAVWHFYNIQGNMCDASHGCGWQRALNIGQTAGFSEDEIRAIVRGNF